MPSLCYPYGSSITCVCDPRGSVYNCFPTDYKGKQGSLSIGEAKKKVSPEEDQRTEILLASTALVAVIALFLSFLIYRMEKYLVKRGFQLPFLHQCNKESLSKMFKQKNSSAVQTDPIIYWYSQNQTVVGITHITTSAPQPAKLYPSLPTRRYSYSPDSADVSTRPSLSSTLPFPRSRSRSSPYEGSEHKSDQVSTPIELREINSYESPHDEISIKMEGEENENIDTIEISEEYSEPIEEHFSACNYSLSQQPLLNLDQLQQQTQQAI